MKKLHHCIIHSICRKDIDLLKEYSKTLSPNSWQWNAIKVRIIELEDVLNNSKAYFPIKKKKQA